MRYSLFFYISANLACRKAIWDENELEFPRNANNPSTRHRNLPVNLQLEVIRSVYSLKQGHPFPMGKVNASLF